MILRCEIRRSNKGNYIGECLELGLAVKGDTTEQCKNNLEVLIDDYIDTLKIIRQEEKELVLTPVSFYAVRKLLFNLRHCLCHISKKKRCDKELIQTRELPIGA